VPDSFFKLASGTIRSVNAVTVSTVTGSLETAGRLMRKYDPDIETMEGAAFFFVCSREAVPFIALRAVSNRVGIRDRGSWNIPLALENLTLVLENLLKKLC
jgi:futalosine hydrolase